MSQMNIEDRVKKSLFANGEATVYAVLDGASIPDLLTNLDLHQPEHECLYRGDLTPELEEAAPHLVALEAESGFTDWLIEQGWGNHWGIFASSSSDLREMRRHFRKFLTVYDTQGKPLMFRYYDPRVLRVYLPTCNADELGVVFGGVQFFVLEAEDRTKILKYRNVEGELKVQIDG